MASEGTLKQYKSAEDVRADIDRTRRQLQASVVALRREVAVATDWRQWVRRHPYLLVGAAFGVGLYLGTRVR